MASTRATPEADRSAPSRRDVTVLALVEAASSLFAERGPDGVSLREIAAMAGVNYGLIHQCVGSKEDLLNLVFHPYRRRPLRLSQLPTSARHRPHGRDRRVRQSISADAAWTLLQGRGSTELTGPLAGLSRCLVTGSRPLLPPIC